MIVLRPDVTAETLEALLAEGAESERLDYKATCDLDNHKALLEITKHLAALLSLGGYILVGVDDQGRPSGQMNRQLAAKFDEANLRQKISRYIEPPFDIQTATHAVQNTHLVLVYVAPHPTSFAVIKQDGHWDEPQKNGKTRQRFVLRQGDVFVRQGTRSVRWQQNDVERVLQRRDDRLREAAREEAVKTMVAYREGIQAQQLAAGPTAGISWNLPLATFTDVITELLRRNDRQPLDLLLVAAPGRTEAAARAGDESEVVSMLDRLISLAAVAATVRDSALFIETIRALTAVYRLGFTSEGLRRNDADLMPQSLWLHVASRVEALGALLVRLERWQMLRELVLVRPHPRESERYTTWLRHGLTEAARANLFKQEDGKINGALVALGRNIVHDLPALRPDRPDDATHDSTLNAPPPPDDALLDSLCQFDALWGLIALVASGGKKHEFYPSFAAYYLHRAEPALARIVTDERVRTETLGHLPDHDLRAAIRLMINVAEAEHWNVLNHPGFFSLSQVVEDFLKADQPSPQ